MKRWILLSWCLLLSLVSDAQQGALDSLLRNIRWYSDIMVNAGDHPHRQMAREQLDATMDQFLSASGSYDVPLDSIQWLRVLHGDGFRVVTWQTRLERDIFTYGGFIQWPDRFVSLKDTRPFINGSLRTTYTPAGWYGCVYYDIVPFRYDRQTYYLLLGFHAENALLNTKLADVLDLSGPEPRFGLPVFTGKGDPQTRLMMTYADVSSCHMRYDEKLKGIVHDHLTHLAGVGPEGEALPVSDGSLEGWLLKNGEWVYKEEVYDMPSKEPPMSDERKNRKEDKDILGRPRNQ